MPSAGATTVVAPAVPPPPRRPSRRRRPLLGLLALVVAAAVVGLLVLGGDAAPAPGTTVPVVRGTVTAQVGAPGLVASASAADVAFTVDGTVASLRVTIGSTVRAGDVLATLDDGTARARAAAATATLTADQRARDAAAAVPVPDPVALARLDAAIATDRAGTTEADRQVDATVLRAPQDGTVIGVALHPGDRVTATSPAAVSVADLSSLVVAAGIGPGDVAGVAGGQEAVVRVDGGAALSGTVADVAPAPGPNGRYRVVVDAALPTTARIGQPVEVTVVLERHTGVLVVPAAAVQRSGPGGATVLVRGPDGTRRQAVTLGLTGPQGVEVDDGLVDGELVVLSAPQSTAS
ncbi:HlyD family efflux transporter periplasmic adaptor subunit [Actinomycetospora sp. TBRC 11914]|uniref:efflux RND transporter periplasmic adaptor subunit n=1 Tax=Actinomycetospora sp. TBRC 11914 TaxID=2729387 RepID=UPI00145D032A|nr:HlyD family efflux transporter periplasmic adaptor subunit [Actinomycetospora sp. TBRC 11914]NMO88927.1 HlyD family efflux transporter periplasmic adaptor subunit [Actinomycetospora sp. TBRC 11914]